MYKRFGENFQQGVGLVNLQVHASRLGVVIGSIYFS